MNTLFQKMRNNRHRLVKAADMAKGRSLGRALAQPLSAEEKHARQQRFLRSDGGAKWNRFAELLETISIFDPALDFQKIEYSAGEWNQGIAFFRQLEDEKKKALDAIKAEVGKHRPGVERERLCQEWLEVKNGPLHETREQRWYRSSAWFKP